MRAYEFIKVGLKEGATVTRIDSKPIEDFASDLKAYKHTDDWSQSGIDTGDDNYWKNKNLKTNTTKGLFAGDPHRTALYATGNAHETRYVEFTQNGQPIVYFDKKDLPAMRSRKTYLTVFDASNFKQLPTGEWFSENPGKPIEQVPIGDPFKYIADQGWIVRVTDDLDKVFKQVQKMYSAGKIAQYGAEGMNESKQSVTEGSYREGGSITHDGVEYDFDRVMSIAEKLPAKTCSVDKLSWILKYDTPNKERLERADITVPLIVTKSSNEKLAAIDGLHRLAKAVRDNVKTVKVKYIRPSDLESARLNQQGVTEDTVNEMALKSYTPLGKFDKPGPFKDPDYKLVVHPKHIEKVTTFFERVPQDFRMFMSNLPGKTKYRESGEKTPEQIKQIFGDKIAAEILKDTEDSITIIYMGNYGLNRQIMNSWQIAHRVGHAITATGRYSRDGEIIEWKALDQYFFNQLNNMLQRYYGVETRGWSPEHRQQLNKQQEALIYQIGVQRSSRERNLNTTYEFLYEMLALYIKTGSVRLNPLPESAGYGRMVGWKKEHKSFERYLRLRPEYRDESVRQRVTDQLARELTSMFNGILDACVGRVFVM